ncbi:MAG TPA: phospholipase [Polyangia bacterium]|nr:phospholipase [Polyangia bacterium]
MPRSYRPDHPAPLAVMLHGAGGNAMGALGPWMALAEEAGVILLAPESRGATWDVILGRMGPDVAFLDRALEYVFDRFMVDPARIVVEGFSDGASYALTVGLAHGALFRQIVAFSPGFSVPPRRVGSPRIFVTHGVRDPVLPIKACSRVIVPRLEGQGYEVRYVEFPDGHTVPRELAREALEWALQRA